MKKAVIFLLVTSALLLSSFKANAQPIPYMCRVTINYSNYYTSSDVTMYTRLTNSIMWGEHVVNYYERNVYLPRALGGPPAWIQPSVFTESIDLLSGKYYFVVSTSVGIGMAKWKEINVTGDITIGAGINSMGNLEL